MKSVRSMLHARRSKVRSSACCSMSKLIVVPCLLPPGYLGRARRGKSVSRAEPLRRESRFEAQTHDYYLSKFNGKSTNQHDLTSKSSPISSLSLPSKTIKLSIHNSNGDIITHEIRKLLKEFERHLLINLCQVFPPSIRLRYFMPS